MSLLPHGLHSGSFIKAPLDAVARCLVDWRNELRAHPIPLQRSRIGLAEACRLLSPRDFNPDRAIILKGPGAWTAFFDNHRDEFMAIGELFVLCERLKTEACFFSYDDYTEHRGTAVFYRNHFDGDVRQRQVMLCKESGWRFEQSGEPLDFEQVDRYALPKKRERLTPEMLRTYGETLGIHFWDPAAYGDDVFYIQWSNTPDENLKPSLEKITQIFGQPNLIMDRFGTRPPPPKS